MVQRIPRMIKGMHTSDIKNLAWIKNEYIYLTNIYEYKAITDKLNRIKLGPGQQTGWLRLHICYTMYLYEEDIWLFRTTLYK